MNDKAENPLNRKTPDQTAANTADVHQSDIFISSSTPVSVTIVDTKNENATTKTTKPTKTADDDRDIIYADDEGQFEENTPDQVRNELPPRGDISQYQSEPSDQFYHELPRSRYTNGPNRQPQAQNVYSKSRGEPTEFDAQEHADLVEIDDDNDRNFTNKQDQQGRYTSNGNKNGQYQDDGNVRGRVIAVTPAPATYQPTETVNHRRIVVAKPVNLVQEVVEADNSTTTNDQRGNYRANYVEERGNQDNNDRYQNSDFNGNSEQYGRYQNVNNNNDQFNGNDEFNRNADYQGDNADFRRNTEYNGQYRNENSNFDRSSNYNGQYRNENTNSGARNSKQKSDYKVNNSNEYSDANYNGDVNYARTSNDQKSKNAKYEDSVSPTTPAGVYISTTPSSASQRIIYVQPVSQDFASQKAVPPKKQ